MEVHSCTDVQIVRHIIVYGQHVNIAFMHQRLHIAQHLLVLTIRVSDVLQATNKYMFCLCL